MIINPKIRGFICTTAHPVGCAQYVQEQIDYVHAKGLIKNGPQRVLVIGASTGYGLSSRVVSAFGCQAATIGVFFEREAESNRTATAGWYHSVAFEQKAKQAKLYAHSFNGDAFSDEIKEKVIETIKRDWGTVDCMVYSVASPRRQHPKTGMIAKSVLKPIGRDYTNKSIDLNTYKLEQVSLPPATEEEITQTVSVMGGEDWEFWFNRLREKNLLSPGFQTIAYSYMGPDLTYPIYRQGTIGRAKDHLELTAKRLDGQLKAMGGHAFISVNKALVTQSSSAIPFIPLYFVLLKKVMKEKRIEESCIEQIYRLFVTRLYNGNAVPLDKNGFIRMDDLEMRLDVQTEVGKSWETLNESNLSKRADLAGYREDFLKLFGFGFKDVDYNADVSVDLKLPSLS